MVAHSLCDSREHAREHPDRLGRNREILRRTGVLKAKTTYPDYEVVVIDNSREREVEQYVKSRSMPGVRYLDWRNKPFNFSAINNAAARQCDSPVLLFLNDDISVIAPGWLTSMVELAVRPEVGAVGAKLLYPGGQIQHAGVILGMFGNCGHAFKDLDGARSHYFNFPDVIRNVSAVTGLLMTRGRHSGRWAASMKKHCVAFQDVDSAKRPGRISRLYTPYALLTHHESLSRRTTHPAPPKWLRCSQVGRCDCGGSQSTCPLPRKTTARKKRPRLNHSRRKVKLRMSFAIEQTP